MNSNLSTLMSFSRCTNKLSLNLVDDEVIVRVAEGTRDLTNDKVRSRAIGDRDECPQRLQTIEESMSRDEETRSESRR